MIDNRTPNFNLPLPNPQNLLTDDVARISDGFTAIDSQLQQQGNAITQANTENSNAITQVRTDLGNDITQANTANTNAITQANTANSNAITQVRTDLGHAITQANTANANAITQAKNHLNTEISNVEALANKSLGIGQTWRDMKALRSPDVNYTNTTGRPIAVNAIFRTTTSSIVFIEALGYVNNVLVDHRTQYATGVAYGVAVSFIVPPTHTYKVIQRSHTFLSAWSELR